MMEKTVSTFFLQPKKGTYLKAITLASFRRPFSCAGKKCQATSIFKAHNWNTSEKKYLCFLKLFKEIICSRYFTYRRGYFYTQCCVYCTAAFEVMVNSRPCQMLLHYQPSKSEVEHFHTSYILGCVLNAFLSYTAKMLNTAVIYAVRKTSNLSLSRPLKTLRLILPVSDLGVGLLCQPSSVYYPAGELAKTAQICCPYNYVKLVFLFLVLWSYGP